MKPKTKKERKGKKKSGERKERREAPFATTL